MLAYCSGGKALVSDLSGNDHMCTVHIHLPVSVASWYDPGDVDGTLLLLPSHHIETKSLRSLHRGRRDKSVHMALALGVCFKQKEFQRLFLTLCNECGCTKEHLKV